MAFNLSTGAQKALLSDAQSIDVAVQASTISFGDGDGVVIAGADTINDSGSGLGVFLKHDWILLVSSGANNNKLVKVLDSSVGKLEVVAGSLVAVAAGASVTIVKLASSGNFISTMRNSVMVAFTGPRPASADGVETGTLLATYTKDQGAFTAGVSQNGLNLGADVAGTALNRAIDPETGVAEVWQGQAVAAGTVGYCRWYANDFVTGASSTAIRMDGIVNTSGADINMAGGTGLILDGISNITSVLIDVKAV